MHTMIERKSESLPWSLHVPHSEDVDCSQFRLVLKYSTTCISHFACIRNYTVFSRETTCFWHLVLLCRRKQEQLQEQLRRAAEEPVNISPPPWVWHLSNSASLYCNVLHGMFTCVLPKKILFIRGMREFVTFFRQSAGSDISGGNFGRAMCYAVTIPSHAIHSFVSSCWLISVKILSCILCLDLETNTCSL